MFPLGVFAGVLGYTLLYVGIANLRNGFRGPTLAQALGFKQAVAPPGSDAPNLVGQPTAEGKIGQVGQVAETSPPNRNTGRGD